MPLTEPYTYIRIISGVQGRSATDGSLSEGVRMVRSALLYADRVEMFSAGISLLRQMKESSGRAVIILRLFLIERAPTSVEHVEYSRCRKEHDKKKNRRQAED